MCGLAFKPLQFIFSSFYMVGARTSCLILNWQLPSLLTHMTPADGALERANMTRSKVRSEYLSQETSLAGGIWEVARESGVKIIKPRLQTPTVLIHSSTAVSVTLPVTRRRLGHLPGRRPGAARESSHPAVCHEPPWSCVAIPSCSGGNC